jgi:hypothetical protein
MYEAIYRLNGSRKTRVFETLEAAFDWLDQLLDRKPSISLALIKTAGAVVVTLKA